MLPLAAGSIISVALRHGIASATARIHQPRCCAARLRSPVARRRRRSCRQRSSDRRPRGRAFALIGEEVHRIVGLPDEIALALFRLHWINVTALQNARYHLRGKVRHSNGTVGVTVVLVDALEGRYIWADNWTGDCNDVLAFEERVAMSVARLVVPALRDAEINRAGCQDPAELDAWGLTMRAL